MQRREAEVALFVRQDLLARGQVVPPEIEEVYQAMAATAAAAVEAEAAPIGTKKKARLQDLNRLASSADSPATAAKAANANKSPSSKIKPSNASEQDKAKLAASKAQAKTPT
jgi:hypothetical protein